MRLGLGHLRMRPDDFWRMTVPEFFSAVDGYLEAKGVKRDGGIAPLTQAEVEAMFDELKDK